MTRHQKNHLQVPEKNSGFALIATISVMVLLVMIALAMLSLSTIELRSSQQTHAMQEARANARMALMMAISELQKHAGPDRRVTAPSGILADDVAYPHILGVWNSWGEGIEDGSHVTESNVKNTYEPGREPRFRTWLMPGDQAEVFNYPQAESNEETVELVGLGSLGSTADARSIVEMPRVAVFDKGRKSGAYSWWIGGENSKARVNLYKEDPAEKAGMTLEAVSAPTFAVAEIDELETLVRDESALRGISHGTLSLLGENGTKLPESAKSRFHDVTVDSVGLLTNTKSAGMRKDLNLLMELDALPTDYAGQEIYTGGPRWDYLRDYCRNYKPFADGGMVKWINGVPHYNPGETWEEVTSRRNWMRHLPVPTKWQWLLSHFSEKAPLGDGEVETDRKYEIRLVFDNIMEIWNPTNLPMTVCSDGRYDYKTFNMPYGMGYQIDGVKWEHLYDGSGTTWQHRPLYWLLRGALGDYGGNTNGIGTASIDWSEVETAPLKAGEVRVFSVNMDAPEKIEPGQRGMPLKPGWEYSGGRYTYGLGHLEQKLEVKSANKITVEFKALENIWQAYGGNEHLVEMYFGGPNGWTGGNDRQYGYSKGIVTDSSFADVAPDFDSEDKIEFTASEIEGVGKKRPFALVGMRMRTEQRVEPSSSSPVSNSELAYSKHSLYADPWATGNGVTNASQLMLRHNSYEFFAQRVNSISDYPLVEISATDQGFMGTSRGATAPLSGQNYLPIREIPFQALISMGQLQHAGLGHPVPDPNHNVNPQDPNIPYQSYPYVANAFGNSWAMPFISGSKIEQSATAPDSGNSRTLHDKSWKINNELWDGWCFSSISPQQHELIAVADRRSMTEVLTDALQGDQPLPNSRYRFTENKQGSAATDSVADLLAADGYKKAASMLACEGAFNVNSTSVQAWKAFLASLDGRSLAWLAAETGVFDSETQRYPVSRFTIPNAEGAKTEDLETDQSEFLGKRWQGMRSLTETEIDELAQFVVEEVRERGPFLSVAEFVNRRLEDDDNGLKGALQDAIDKTSINDSFKNDSGVAKKSSMEITANDIATVGYQNVEAAVGFNGDGAPGYVTQADFLMPLAPLVRVRSDTFRIRAYGESVNASGEVIARAYCEAVVQRIPEYVDSSDEPEKEVLNASNQNQLTQANQVFGRQFKIKSFRWLSQHEV